MIQHDSDTQINDSKSSRFLFVEIHDVSALFFVLAIM